MAERISQKIKTQKKVLQNATQHFSKAEKLIDELYEEILEWRKISKCSSPFNLKLKLEKTNKDIDTINNLKTEIQEWKNVTNCSTPQQAQSFILSLQNDTVKEMYEDPICNMYMWHFSGKSKMADDFLINLEEFNIAFEDIIDHILNHNFDNISDIPDPYNFIDFLIFLYESDFVTNKIDLNLIYKVINNG